MGILDKTRQQLAERQKQQEEKDKQDQASYDFRSQNSHNRALAFVRELGLPNYFRVVCEEGTVEIWRHHERLATAVFGWDRATKYEAGEDVGWGEPFEVCHITYHKDFEPHNWQSHKHKKAGRRERFYPTLQSDMLELGEFLLQEGER